MKLYFWVMWVLALVVVVWSVQTVRQAQTEKPEENVNFRLTTSGYDGKCLPGEIMMFWVGQQNEFPTKQRYSNVMTCSEHNGWVELPGVRIALGDPEGSSPWYWARPSE